MKALPSTTYLRQRKGETLAQFLARKQRTHDHYRDARRMRELATDRAAGICAKNRFLRAAIGCLTVREYVEANLI